MKIRFHVIITACALAFVAAVAGGCSRRSDADDGPSRRGSAPAMAPPATPPRADTPARARPRIVFLGDSLTAGLGLAMSESYPSLIQRRLDAAGLDYEVMNAGVSGDTSAGGLTRLDWALDGDVRILVVALGGNDALRALPAGQLKQNLATIIERAQARRITVLLAGMEAPPNFGRDYIVSFHKVYPELASTYHVAFVPFLLQGVAGIDALNQRDGIHPTAEGAQKLADTVWAVLKPLAEGEKRSGS
ncbi:MAG TPA: arylesterase [Vicinamibacterales bacterium]|nr:arylesterase [Vicinamibacterales bacterium]